MEVLKPKVLIVDDDPVARRLLVEILNPHGFHVLEADSGEIALVRVKAEPPAAIILDLVMPHMNGIQMLEQLKETAPCVPVIMLTAHGDIPSAVQAMRLGAYHFLTKPVRDEELVRTLQRAVEQNARLLEMEDLKGQFAAGTSLDVLMGPSPEVQRLAQEVWQVAESSLAVVIYGETGTGKEIVARAIHQQSSRSTQPFVAVDCGAIPETLIESELFGYERGAFTGAERRQEGQFRRADGGTLFLDEITNLSMPTQAKLLRVLQEKQVYPLGGTRPVPVDARVLAASNLRLEQEMQAGRFRPDLYYRIAEYVIALPPLKTRPDDILYLATRFLAEAGKELKSSAGGISPEAAQVLRQYAWPGNVRELKNVIRRAAVLSGGSILPEHLDVSSARSPGETKPGIPPDLPELSLKAAREKGAAEAERKAIEQALRAARGNKTEAARLLKTDFKTLHLKMKRYRISREDFLEG
jgi:DNA-binding NtrC family response regulator